MDHPGGQDAFGCGKAYRIERIPECEGPLQIEGRKR